MCLVQFAMAKSLYGADMIIPAARTEPRKAAMDLLNLPFDILDAILRLISQQDALQFAQTNHCAYDIAMRWVLSSVIIGENRPPGLRFGLTPPPPMRGARQLSLLTTFLLSDVERWPTCIRTLTLHPNAFGCPAQPGRLFSQRDYSVGPLFAEALRNARNLHTVEIGDIEVLLQQCPSFDRVLCQFTRLDRIRFSGLGPLSAALLEDLGSLPKRIQLHGVGSHIQAVFHGLRPHAYTVEVLELDGCFSLPASLETSVFPHVHSLVLGGYAPPLSTMAEAFPNVRIGRFHNFRPSGKAMVGVEWVNWPSLDTIEISTLLPLASRVRHIRLGAGLILNPHTPSETVSGLLNILQRTQPVVLSCTISGLPPGLFEGLVANVRSIRYLEMKRINTFRDNVGSFVRQRAA